MAGIGNVEGLETLWWQCGDPVVATAAIGLQLWFDSHLRISTMRERAHYEQTEQYARCWCGKAQITSLTY